MRRKQVQLDIIIPYQELPGNYNNRELDGKPPMIIPYQKLPGNYNFSVMSVQ